MLYFQVSLARTTLYLPSSPAQAFPVVKNCLASTLTEMPSARYASMTGVCGLCSVCARKSSFASSKSRTQTINRRLRKESFKKYLNISLISLHTYMKGLSAVVWKMHIEWEKSIYHYLMDRVVQGYLSYTLLSSNCLLPLLSRSLYVFILATFHICCLHALYLYVAPLHFTFYLFLTLFSSRLLIHE